MMRNRIAVWLALAGSIAAVGAVLYDNRQAATQEPPGVALPQAPYDAYVSAVGLVEASSGNITIGTPVGGVVRNIDVKVGDRVHAGDPLFELDDLDLQAQLVTANARVEQASASLLKPKHQLDNAENLGRLNADAISDQRLSDLRDDYALAQAALALAKAEVEHLKIEIGRRKILAPVDGTILQMKIRTGEYMDADTREAAAMVIGNENPLFVRVDVDENEAWRVREGAPATAFVRGNPAIRAALEFQYFEPYVIPKTVLTGQSTERTDRRVLQVIFSFEPDDLPVYVGQQLDVFIEAAPLTAAGAPPSAR